MYLHFDLNKFYASCIRAFMPWLNGVPVVVLSNNDGCSISQTKEAQAFGIAMGTKLFEHPWSATIKRKGIKVFSTNFTLFADMSLRVKAILRRHFDIIEDYSIDEIFIWDDSPLDVLLVKAHECVEQISTGLHMPISCGIAHTKTLAKAATSFAKKHAGYHGVCPIYSDQQRRKALQLTEIGDVWGIGREHRKRLNKMGIMTAYDFLYSGRITPEWVQKYMTKVGMKTFLELQGQSRIDIEMVEPPKKNIMVSRSFGRNVNELDALFSAIMFYPQMNAAKLRRQGLKAKKIHIFLSTNPFRDDHEQSVTRVDIPLPVATSSNIEIGEYARLAIKAMFKPGRWYKKAGIMTSDIVKEREVQANLFDCRDRAKEDRLMKAWDYLTGRYGRGVIYTGMQRPQSYDWWVRQEKLSPRWTTQQKDFPVCVDVMPTKRVALRSNGFGALTTVPVPVAAMAA